jgi:hypothetical protein
MRRVALEDLAGPSRYGEMRDAFRRRIIALKRDRRVAVGDRVTLVFENFDTVLFERRRCCTPSACPPLDRVREGSRSTRAAARRTAVGDDVDQITEQPDIAAELHRLISGIDEHLSLRVGDASIAARFGPGRSTGGSCPRCNTCASRWARRRRGPSPAGDVPIEFRIDHPNYEARAMLTPASARASPAIWAGVEPGRGQGPQHRPRATRQLDATLRVLLGRPASDRRAGLPRGARQAARGDRGTVYRNLGKLLAAERDVVHVHDRYARYDARRPARPLRLHALHDAARRRARTG